MPRAVKGVECRMRAARIASAVPVNVMDVARVMGMFVFGTGGHSSSMAVFWLTLVRQYTSKLLLQLISFNQKTNTQLPQANPAVAKPANHARHSQSLRQQNHRNNHRFKSKPPRRIIERKPQKRHNRQTDSDRQRRFLKPL